MDRALTPWSQELCGCFVDSHNLILIVATVENVSASVKVKLWDLRLWHALETSPFASALDLRFLQVITVLESRGGDLHSLFGKLLFGIQSKEFQLHQFQWGLAIDFSTPRNHHWNSQQEKTKSCLKKKKKLVWGKLERELYNGCCVKCVFS